VNQPIDCIRCHSRMEAGFIPDIGEGMRQQQWAPGSPHPSFWTGLKIENQDEVVPVITYRCPNCGYLESYAVPKPTQTK
jgi:predicted nucleic-acid-binding Zn-ribbon protein